jgi:hypothetical protein
MAIILCRSPLPNTQVSLLLRAFPQRLQLKRMPHIMSGKMTQVELKKTAELKRTL